MAELKIPVPEFCGTIHRHQLAVLRDFDARPEVRHRVLVWHRRARKTTLGINLLIRECVANVNQTYALIFPTFNQAKAVAWRDPMMVKRYLPSEILKKPFNESELVGEFKSGSVLQIGGADNPERWKGMGCQGWILDEFALMRNGKQLYQETIYPIIRENKGWCNFSYTPKGRNHGWEFLKKAMDNPTSWAYWHLPVSKSGLLTPEEIEEARREMPSQLFAQELECQFLEAGGGVIKRVREAIVGQLQQPSTGQRYVMGVDLGRKEDWTVLTIINCATRHVDAWERFQQIDWGFQKEKIAILSKKYNNPLIILDSTGLGDVIEGDLKRLGLSVRGYQFTSKSKRQLIEKLIVSIEGRHVTYPDIPVLIEELEDFDIDIHGRYGAPEGLHDDCVISLALAIEGLGAEAFHAVPSERDNSRRREAEERHKKELVNCGYGE